MQNTCILGGKFFKLKCRDYLIKELKAIKSKKNIFCYLFIKTKTFNIRFLTNLDF